MTLKMFKDNHTFVGFIKIDKPHFIDFNGEKRDRIFIGVYDNDEENIIHKVGQGVCYQNRKLVLGIKLYNINYKIKIVDINFDYMENQDIEIYKSLVK